MPGPLRAKYIKPISAILFAWLLTLDLGAQVSYVLSSSPGTGNSPVFVLAVDLNGDGKVDLVSANTQSGTLTVLTNSGHGGFSTASSPSVGSLPYSACSADFNGDGKLDLASANRNGNSVSILTNSGSGTFITTATLGVGPGPACIIAADVNGDGKPDLITANTGTNTLTILTNNGLGVFVISSSPPVGNSPLSVCAADVNGDGKMDLISANYADASLTILTNNGGGGFITASTIPLAAVPFCLTTADVNGDGYVDLITVNGNANTLTILTNNGAGGFVLSTNIAIGATPYCVTAADVNGDGRPDLIASYYNPGGTLTVLTNNGRGGFATALTPSVGSNPLWVTAADVNGDGKMDLISANDSAIGTLSILTNSTPFPTPPTITNQPIGQTNYVGGTTLLGVGVQSSVTVTFQWRFDGTNIASSNTNSLALTNLTLSEAGTYDVIVSNSYGSVTSTPVILNVQFLLVNVNGQLALGTVSAIGSAQVSFLGGYQNGFVFYTLDGSVPDYGSILYTVPFTLTNSASVQALDLSSDFSQEFFVPSLLVQIVPLYNLQTSVLGQGTMSAAPTNNPYPSNSVVVLTASAATNWSFDHWTNGATGNQNPLSVTMNGPRAIQAVFVQSSFPVTVTTPGGGSVTVNGLAAPINSFFSAGSALTLTASPSNGWSFLGWQGSAAGASNPLILTVNQTNNIQAIFGTTLTMNPVGGGSVILSQPNPIPYGATVTVSAAPNAGEYFVLWSGAAAGTNSPATIAVTNPGPAVDALFATLPSGKVGLSVVINGSGTVAINPHAAYYNSGSTITLTAAAGTNAGAHFYGWTQGAAGNATPLAVVLTSNSLIQANFTGFPTAVVSPQNVTVGQGSNTVLTVIAGGLLPLTYQWQSSQGGIVGATNSTFPILNAQSANGGIYSVVVSNVFGSVTSGVVTVTVGVPPTISSQPASQIAASGGVVTLNVTAAGTAPLSYQWWNTSGSIAGATNSSYALNPAGTNNGDNYFVMVSNPYGTTNSAMAALIIYAPVSILNPPANQIVSSQGTANFSVTASGYPAALYQWTFNGTNLAGALSAALTITNVGLGNLGSYAVVISNAYSGQTSAVVSLSMLPSIVTPYSGATAFWGSTAVLSVGVIGTAPLGYQWYVGGLAIASATNAILNLPAVQFTNSGLYSVVASNPVGAVTNVPALLQVIPPGISIDLYGDLYPGITVMGAVGYNYIIERTADLSSSNSWTTATNLTLSQPTAVWMDTNVGGRSPGGQSQFYKVLPGP